MASQKMLAPMRTLLIALFSDAVKPRSFYPAISTVERLCADALVAAERRVEPRARLDELLIETVKGHVSHFVWMREFEIGNNSTDANNLLDRLECPQKA
jgi:hypothetical protein